MKKILSIFSVSFALVFSSSAFANTIGVVYDSGGKFDKSFNELAFNTAERVVNELGWSMIEFESANDTITFFFITKYLQGRHLHLYNSDLRFVFLIFDNEKN